MALRINPEDDEARYNLAVVQKMINDDEQEQDEEQQQEQDKDQKGQSTRVPDTTGSKEKARRTNRT